MDLSILFHSIIAEEKKNRFLKNCVQNDKRVYFQANLCCERFEQAVARKDNVEIDF